MNEITATRKSNVTAVINPGIDAQAKERLITARIGLLLRAPFFGNMATRLSLVNADTWLETIATDGRNFYYNSAFVMSLPVRQLEFGFGHEVLHNIYDHLGRLHSRDRRIANIAMDYVVNFDLVEQKIGDKITVVDIIYDTKYGGWTWEDVYDDLMKNVKKIDVEMLHGRVLDNHMDPEAENKNIPQPTAAEREEIRNEIREAMLAAASAAGADNLPGGVKRMIKDLTEPQLDWRELLQQQIQSTMRSNYSWLRPSRRGWHQDAIMPGMDLSDKIDVFIAVDTSGSISDSDLKCFLSEIQGIMESYDQYRIRLVTWDTKVHNLEEFTSENMREITEYTPGGGGGTDPHCIWEWLQEEDIQPKKLIVFTDYCFFNWNPSAVCDYADTVWIIKSNKEANPEFGVFAHYDDSK
jgi:predicted metal-dependent peptidase